MTYENNWYSVSTVAGAEEKVFELLKRKKITGYIPLHIIQKQTWEGFTRTHTVPLFLNTIFVFISEGDMITVKQTKGVLNFYYWLNKPAIISHEDIAAIREVTLLCDSISLEKAPVLPFCKKGAVIVPENFNSIAERNKRINKIHLSSIGFYLIFSVPVAIAANPKKQSPVNLVEEDFLVNSNEIIY